MDAITTEGLVKIYKSRTSEVRALDGVDLNVPDGIAIFAPLGVRRYRSMSR